MLQRNTERMPLHCPIQSRRKSGIRIPWLRAVMSPPPFAMWPMSLPESREFRPLQYLRRLGKTQYECSASVRVQKSQSLMKAKRSNSKVACSGPDGYCVVPNLRETVRSYLSREKQYDVNNIVWCVSTARHFASLGAGIIAQVCISFLRVEKLVRSHNAASNPTF